MDRSRGAARRRGGSGGGNALELRAVMGELHAVRTPRRGAADQPAAGLDQTAAVDRLHRGKPIHRPHRPLGGSPEQLLGGSIERPDAAAFLADSPGSPGSERPDPTRVGALLLGTVGAPAMGDALHEYMNEGMAFKHDEVLELMGSGHLTPESEPAQSSFGSTPGALGSALADVATAQVTRSERLAALEALMALSPGRHADGNGGQQASADADADAAASRQAELEELARIKEENRRLTEENSQLRADAHTMAARMGEAAELNQALRDENARLAELPLQDDSTVQEVLQVGSGANRSVFVQKMITLRLQATQQAQENEQLRGGLLDLGEQVEMLRRMNEHEMRVRGRAIEVLERRAINKMRLGCVEVAWESWVEMSSG